MKFTSSGTKKEQIAKQITFSDLTKKRHGKDTCMKSLFDRNVGETDGSRSGDKSEKKS